MVIPVVQHDGAEKRDARHCHELALVGHQAPGSTSASARRRLRGLDFALRTLCSSVGISSALVAACGWVNCGGCAVDCIASSATPAGTVAMCSASWPSVIDFGCGFHPRCSCGTRSSTRLVVCASCSSSCNIAVDHRHRWSPPCRESDLTIASAAAAAPARARRPARRQTLAEVVRHESECGMPKA